MQTVNNFVKVEKTIFDDNNILVSNSHTCYVNLILPEDCHDYTPSWLMNKYKSLLSMAKNNNINVKYRNKTYSRIKQLNFVLPSIMEKHIEDFYKLQEKWKQKTEKGISIPTIEDNEYNQLVEEGFLIEKNYFRNSHIGLFLDLVQDLNRQEKMIENKSKDSEVTIYI